jgi:tripartite-type tricarboxylate transporter receptor subunit TctC
LLAPAATPREIVPQLNASVQKVSPERDVIDRLAGVSANVMGGMPKQFAAYIAREHERWAVLIRQRGIKVG